MSPNLSLMLSNQIDATMPANTAVKPFSQSSTPIRPYRPELEVRRQSVPIVQVNSKLTNSVHGARMEPERHQAATSATSEDGGSHPMLAKLKVVTTQQ